MTPAVSLDIFARSRIRAATRFATVCAALSLVVSSSALASDFVELSTTPDHSAVSRYKGATLLGYSEAPFERVVVATSRLEKFDASLGRLRAAREEPVEGVVRRYIYAAPPTTSGLEVYRNYERALSTQGFTKVFACGPTDCGAGATHATLYQRSLPRPPQRVFGAIRFFANKSFYVVAKGGSASAPLWVIVMVGEYERSGSPEDGRPVVYQIVIEPRATSLGNVAIAAEQVASSIAADGKVALYGLYFDTNSATLRAESKPQLEEVAKFLRGNPQLSVIVVGHTDSQGSIDLNLQLSEKRAIAVATALRTEYGIDSGRLTAKGVGMLAPVASNRGEAGRAKNRRVEIVER